MTKESTDGNWKTEFDIEGTPNITPNTPAELGDEMIWKAAKAILAQAETIDDVWRIAREWNSRNNPPVPAKKFNRMVLWALENFDSNLKKG